ncbi:MAG: MarC family protein, partial [Planctomycetota bacterium]
MWESIPAEAKVAIQSVLALYIVVNPSGVASIFLGLTRDAEPAQRRRAAFLAVVAGAVTLAAFALAGTYLFRYLRITGATLQIAGGMFVFGVAFALARGKEG